LSGHADGAIVRYMFEDDGSGLSQVDSVYFFVLKKFNIYHYIQTFRLDHFVLKISQSFLGSSCQTFVSSLCSLLGLIYCCCWLW